jgi:hypothetical protein
MGQSLNLKLFSDLEYLSPRLVTTWLAFRVLQISLSNLSWSQYKSWSISYGEGLAKSCIMFDQVLAVNFRSKPSKLNRIQVADTATLEHNYLLIHNSNGRDPLIKVGEHEE